MAFKMKGPKFFGNSKKVAAYVDSNELDGTDYKKGVKKTVTRRNKKGEVKTREKMITSKKAARQIEKKQKRRDK